MIQRSHIGKTKEVILYDLQEYVYYPGYKAPEREVRPSPVAISISAQFLSTEPG
jgi:hypothetical protein